MGLSFQDFINGLVESIDSANTYIIDQITQSNTKFEHSCVKPNLTFDKYFEVLKKKWDYYVNKLLKQTNECDQFSKLSFLYNIIQSGSKTDFSKIDINEISKQVSNTKKMSPDELKKQVTKFAENEGIQDIILDAIADTMIDKKNDYKLNRDVVMTIHNLLYIISSRNICWLWDIIAVLGIAKYKNIIGSKTKEEIKQLLREDIKSIINFANELELNQAKGEYNSLIAYISNYLSNLHRIRSPPKTLPKGQPSTQFEALDEKLNKNNKNPGLIEKELDKLIPPQAGAMKSFFIKTITAYFDKLHPIIWAQILKQILVNFMIEIPLTKDELFRFLSKHILLNSGPFILKILQQIRPNIPQNLLVKYNLNKLKYPMMIEEQYLMILKRVVIDWDMYKISGMASASVGQVFFVYRVDSISRLVIKIAKPLSIAQSCFEYSALIDVFPQGSCKHEFVKNMLQATGKELYTPNEIKNINDASKMYSMNYSVLFSETSLSEKITSVKHIDKVINPKCWFALAMSEAEGVPVSSLIEGEQSKLLKDTPFRASLHRCADLLVYVFFIGFIQYGKYHGDLHAGNIYFSYSKKLMTIIDFGAMGELNLFKTDPVTQSLINIILMSIQYNYTDMLDTITKLVNSKCDEEKKIDMKSNKYKKFRIKLKKIKYNNMLFADKEIKLTDDFKNKMLNQKRLDLEKNNKKHVEENNKNSEKEQKHTLPYDFMDIKRNKSSTQIIDNTDALPYDISIEKTKIISFSYVMSLILEFYAMQDINIAVKFAEFYELIKAYKLLTDVLNQMGYPSYRMSIVMNKVIFDTGNLKKLLEVTAVINMLSAYTREKAKYDKLLKKINKMKKTLKQKKKTLDQKKKIQVYNFWLSKD